MAGSRMSTQSEVLLRIDEEGGTRALVLEDDGRVAYAYLLDEDKIVGDVWLYNVEVTPEEVDWKDKSQMPFLNPRRFCKEATVPRLAAQVSVRCDWFERGVAVKVEGMLLARLEHGSKPGWSKLASRSGPLAKPLEP